MPAPGEQHLASGGRTAITNPFEEVRPRISEYTAQEIITLQTRLDKQLGPEYISSRSGPGGQKIHYLAGEKCIQLANEVLGFNGWSSQIKDLQVDYVDENPQTGKVSLGLSVVVRVTLRDGTFHEDLGYGHIENAKGKAAAFEKSKKEATTDGLKRALRMFGNVLGNCIKDKDYLQKVLKVKVPAPKWDVDNLHRHSTFAATVKPEAVTARAMDEKSHNTSNGSSVSNNTSIDIFDDEFGDFDEADFNVADPDSHPDEVVLIEPSAASNNFPGQNNNLITNAKPQNQVRPQNRSHPIAGPPGRPQAVNAPSANPQTPNAGFNRSTSGAGAQAFRPPQENGPQSRAIPQGPPHPVVKRVLNQPSRSNGVGSAPVSPARPPTDDLDSVGLPPQGAGFFSARGVAGVIGKNGNGDNADPNAPPPPIPTNIAAFNPNLESPSIRRSEGVDHKSSKPLGRDGKHIPSPSPAVAARGNIINPQLDATRRIGAPGSPSPMANRNMYKPPSKRPVDSRAPLVDLPANGHLAGGDMGGDAKRQRMNG